MKFLWRVTTGLILVIAGSFSVLSSARPAAATPRQCIISLSPSATETLFTLGAGKSVVAVDTTANFPRRGLPKRKIDAFNPSVEAILSLCSTTHALVVLSYDANQIKEKLTSAGVKVLEQQAPTTLSGAYRQILQLGMVTHHSMRSRELVNSMKKVISRAIRSVPVKASSLRAYYELDPTYYSLTSGSFVGSILRAMHVQNIADAKGITTAGGYPQLSPEYVASANPNIIFMADSLCCAVSAKTLSLRPALGNVSAVTHHQLFTIDDDVASRWGPRLSILVTELAHDIRMALAHS